MEAQATLRDAIIWFADYEHCRQFMVELRWRDGKVKCPRCGAEKVTYLENARVWKCYAKHERPTFTLKTGTLFEDSPIALEKWLPCAWLIANCKNGISSYEIGRDLGVTQKSAWFMLQRLRLAMQDTETGGKLSGQIEVDETFIGGAARFMHQEKKLARRGGRRKAPGPQGKAIVAAVLERGTEDSKSKVRATVVAKRKKQGLQALVRENVEAGSAVYTDALQSYDGLSTDYLHQVIDHAEAYVDGQVHTNGTENFWSLLKRGLKGTYVSVEPFHLFRYVDEQAFRFNNREFTDAERFASVLKQIVGRRLTYQEVTGKTESASSS
jgi:transposase-like protein